MSASGECYVIPCELKLPSGMGRAVPSEIKDVPVNSSLEQVCDDLKKKYCDPDKEVIAFSFREKDKVQTFGLSQAPSLKEFAEKGMIIKVHVVEQILRFVEFGEVIKI